MPDDPRTAASAPSLSERLYEATARVTRIVHLPLMVVDSPLDSDLWDYLDDQGPFDAIAAHLGITDIELAEHVDQYGVDASSRMEAFAEIVAHRLDGWLVTVDQAKHEPHPGTGSCSIRLGWRQGRTFYGATYEEAVTAAVEWAEARADAAMEAAR